MIGRPLRVVFCIDSLSVGGTEMNALHVAEQLDRTRFTVSVACFRGDGPLRPQFDAAGIPIDEFPLRSLYGPGMLREGLRFMRFLHRERVDVVHAHDRYSNVFGVPWARLAGTRAVIASKRWGSISRVHAAGNRGAYRLAHRVLANSHAVGASLVEVDGVPPDRIVIIPNFVEADAFSAAPSDWLAQTRTELALGDGALAVGIVANLRPIKDHATLLRAIARLLPRFPTVRLVLVGGGEMHARLEALAETLGLGHVMRFAGVRPNRPNLHRLFDISVLCSVSEGFPNSIVEAMAAARPVVATAVGGVSDAVTDGVNGFLVAAGDDLALSHALVRLLESRELRVTMGEAGQQIARDRFRDATVVPQIERLYTALAGPERP